MKILILFLFLVVACTQIKLITPGKEDLKKEVVPTGVVTLKVQPGMVTYLEFKTGLSDGKILLDCRGTELPVMITNHVLRGYIGESYFSDRKPFTCTYTKDDHRIDVLSVQVEMYNYKQERLYVDKKRVVLSKEDQERVLREKEIKKRIYQKSASYYLFSGEFEIPLHSKITSYYGTKRIFNNKKQSQHLGNDYRAKVGVPIPSSNDGIVVFTGNLFYSGNIVIVDHGLNIFTAYGHLSDIKVTEGTLIKKGDIVGLSGATGRVSGPHLHWGVKVNGDWIDGHSLVEASKQHFKINRHLSTKL